VAISVSDLLCEVSNRDASILLAKKTGKNWLAIAKSKILAKYVGKFWAK